MKTGSEIFLDTNILVYSTLKDFDAEKNFQCREVFKILNERDFRDYREIEVIEPQELIAEARTEIGETENQDERTD